MFSNYVHYRFEVTCQSLSCNSVKRGIVVIFHMDDCRSDILGMIGGHILGWISSKLGMLKERGIGIIIVMGCPAGKYNWSGHISIQNMPMGMHCS